MVVELAHWALHLLIADALGLLVHIDANAVVTVATDPRVVRLANKSQQPIPDLLGLTTQRATAPAVGRCQTYLDFISQQTTALGLTRKQHSTAL